MNATATSPTGASATQPPLTLEQKIEAAAEDAAQAASIFSAPIAAAIQAGVAVEPIVSAFAQLIVGLFKKHTA